MFSTTFVLVLFSFNFRPLPHDKTVVLNKDSGILGIKIAGGTIFDSLIYVTGIEAGGLAEKSEVGIGDRLVSVNGKLLDGLEHEEVVAILKNASGIVKLVVHSFK